MILLGVKKSGRPVKKINFFFFFLDPNYNIRELDIAVNAVATALKDFFKRFPSILTQDQMDEMEEISSKIYHL